MRFKAFEEFFEIPLRNGLTKPKRVRGEGYKMVNMGELFKYPRINNIPMDRVPLNDKELASSMLQSGDLLFARQSLVLEGAGQCSIFVDDDEEACFESHLIRCRLNKDIANPLFYYYFFSSQIGKQTIGTIVEQGAGASGIRGSDLAKVLVPELDIEVQDAIAFILDQIDSKIELNQQINQTLEQIAQAIFKSWFVDFEPVKAKIAALEAGGSEDDALLAAMQVISGKDPQQLTQLQTENPENYATLRATAELFPAAMQESELGEIPVGWEVLPLSKMVELIGGGTPKRSEPTYWGGDICWFSVRDAPNDGNVFVIDTDENITEAGLKGSSTRLLPLGTTIITARGTVGKLALTGVITAMNQSCYGVVGVEGTGPYLNYLQVHEAVETLQRNTHGAVFDTITRTTFETVFQTQASVDVRDNFEKLVTPMFEGIKNNLQQTKVLSELRDTLLPKLLSGELSVSDIESRLTEAD